MKNIKLKNLMLVSLTALIVLFSARPFLEKKLDQISLFDGQEYLVDFVDDSEVRIKMNRYANRIISLDTAHTENLFSLNLENEIIGVSKFDNYPLGVIDKKTYDYQLEPEKILEANPDLVLVTPFIERENPAFVKTLKRTGINVVSLYPVEFRSFSDYIRKLGQLTGKINTAEILIQSFCEEIEELEEITKNLNNKVNVFVETSEIGYKTVIEDSFAANAIRIAGGQSIAKDVVVTNEKTFIGEFGFERIIENANEIDVYLSQRGGVSSGGNIHSIEIRPGFDKIKALQNNRVYELSERLLSQPTLRYIKGIKELCRILHPEVFANINDYASDELITRELIAEMSVKYAGKSIYMPSSSYYRKEHEGHTYGFFEDVPLDHKRFDFIETAVLSGFMTGFQIDEVESFLPENNITRDELARIVYMLGNISKQEKHKEIKDIGEIHNKKIVQTLVDNEIFELSDGYFKPQELVTGNEVIEVLNRMKEIKAADS